LEQDYFLTPWLGRAVTLKELPDILVGVATPVGFDMETLDNPHEKCHYPMYLIAESGCSDACPIGINNCFSETLPELVTLVSSPSKRDSWYPSQAYRSNDDMDKLKETLKKARLVHSKYVSAIYTQRGFSLDSWPVTSWLSWDSEDDCRDLHKRAREAAKASREFKKSHCDRCALDCPSYLRRRCGSIVTPQTVENFVDHTLVQESGWTPSTAWNDRVIQAGLSLGGETVQLDLEKGCRKRRYVINKVYKPKWPATANSVRYLKDWAKASTSKVEPALVRLSLDWGTYDSYEVPLSALMKHSPEVAKKVKAWRPVGLSKQLTKIYMFLTTLDGVKHSSFGWTVPIKGIRPSVVDYVNYHSGLWSPHKGLKMIFGKRWEDSMHFRGYLDLHRPSHGLDMYVMMAIKEGWKYNF
jgi:hypothetical protein